MESEWDLFVEQVYSPNACFPRVVVISSDVLLQLLKAWGADLTVVCGSKSLERVLTLGADIALDYNKYDVKKELKEIPRLEADAFEV